MAGATFLPIPKAIDLEAHHYPRHWKRNLFFLYGGAMLVLFQFQRYTHLCRVSIKCIWSKLTLEIFLRKMWFDFSLILLRLIFLATLIVVRRVHGLVKPQRSQESQILSKLSLSAIYLLDSLNEVYCKHNLNLELIQQTNQGALILTQRLWCRIRKNIIKVWIMVWCLS